MIALVLRERLDVRSYAMRCEETKNIGEAPWGAKRLRCAAARARASAERQRSVDGNTVWDSSRVRVVVSRQASA